MIVRNNELGFMPKHVRALCHVGASSKGKGAKGYIGQKGIGFKSVFRVSGAPEVHSRGFHFSLDQFMVVPHALPPSASLWLPPADKAAFLKKGKSRIRGTVIVLPLNDEFANAKREELSERLGEITPQLLLFLNRLRRISCTERDGASGDESHGPSSRVMERRDCSVSPGVSIIELRDSSEGDQAAPRPWLVVKRSLKTVEWASRSDAVETEIAAAFALDSTLNEKDLNVFAFLPVAPYGFRFVFQADFVLSSSREVSQYIYAMPGRQSHGSRR